ncbi:hypothetical protein ATS72_015600 [Pseudoalteromonas sp. 13-15]|uniref:hypothetical protein n=1 Tax=Pseudoalteromonas TaxID=53246 RepID=UPI000730B656|nr:MULTISPECIES: hypothetical protein [Pseudoalteromonas]AUL75061.1 hypothetical protein ATS72_015600 [Pseudoalteromonas sp. 13-15]WFO21093.1 hypothetical protein ATS73_017265 [Pseudoalteromonas sp. H100]SIO19552.1 hypothetical protein SAMN05878071_3132 [Pseudoalteromonas marina]
MKIWILFLLFSFSFSGYSNSLPPENKSVNPVLKVMECLQNIPDSEITNPEHTISKELSLMTSVIENITLELGTNTKEQKEFRELYKVAFKHCPTEITTLKAGYKSTANKKLNKDKKQLAFAPSSLILANNFLPVN